MSQHKTLEAAARAYGASHGVTGHSGGWLRRHGAVLCQGWHTYGVMLVNAHEIHVLDEVGKRIDHEQRPGKGSISRGWNTVRPDAAAFYVPESERPRAALGLEPGQVPEAVAVDTSWSYVFSAAEDGRPFTIEGAKAFAAKRNEGLKVPTYKVFRLTEVTEES